MMMMPRKLLRLWLLMVIISTTLSNPDSPNTNPTTRIQRSTANLEYVMKVLEEQGRLDEVDGDLLKRIQTTILKNKAQGNSRSRSGSERAIDVKQVLSTPRVSALDRARTRQHQQQLFGARPARGQNRSPLPEPKRSSPFSNRNQLLGGECQALKTENSILKQQLLAAQSQPLQQLETRRGLQVEEPVRALHLLNSIQVELLLLGYNKI